MANTATVAPSLGHGALTTQTGVTAGFDAIDDRRQWAATRTEGILTEGGYAVSQRGAGANMTVDVAASTGDGALVKGDSVTSEGLYLVPPSSGVLNVDIAAADATNPRNDLVVLEVKCDTHDASGLNLSRVRVITGTPNAGAALTSAFGANGTPSLPSTCLPLAVVRVPAAATSVTNAYISDRRVPAGRTSVITSSLPASPVDGQECFFLADSSTGAVWHLRYRSASGSSYKWEFVGGAPMTNVGTGTTGLALASYTMTDWTTSARVTLPLAGDYILTGRVNALQTAGTDGQEIQLALGKPTPSAIVSGYAVAKNQAMQLTGMVRVTAQALGDIVRVYAAASGGTWTTRLEEIHVTPIRVG